MSLYSQVTAEYLRRMAPTQSHAVRREFLRVARNLDPPPSIGINDPETVGGVDNIQGVFNHLRNAFIKNQPVYVETKGMLPNAEGKIMEFHITSESPPIGSFVIGSYSIPFSKVQSVTSALPPTSLDPYSPNPNSPTPSDRP